MYKFLAWQVEGNGRNYIIRSYGKSCEVANDDFMVWHVVSKYLINVVHYYLEIILSYI